MLAATITIIVVAIVATPALVLDLETSQLGILKLFSLPPDPTQQPVALSHSSRACLLRWPGHHGKGLYTWGTWEAGDSGNPRAETLLGAVCLTPARAEDVLGLSSFSVWAIQDTMSYPVLSCPALHHKHSFTNYPIYSRRL